MKLSREIKTALLVLVSIAILLWGYNFLKGKNIFDSNRKFYVEYENVEGLSTASAVTINGLNVGKVNQITIQESGKLLVELLMTNPIDIPKESKAIIYSPGFLGGKQIAIETNFTSKEMAQDGDYLIPSNKSGLLDGLGEKADPLIQKLDSVLHNVNQLVVSVNTTLDPEVKTNLKTALEELKLTMINAKEITGKFDRIVANNEGRIDDIVTSFNETATNFNQTSKDLNVVSKNVSEADIQGIVAKFDHAAATLDHMITSVDNGEGSIGKLMKDENLYANINKASKELNELLEDIKLNPKRYVNISVFGKKADPYVVPDTLKK